jgi:trigger factor
MPPTSLQTVAEQVEKDRVKLRVEVPEKALSPALAAAYSRWAREVRIPGFRKGKVPRQLIDARVGADVVREEALRDALPGFYREALDVEDLEAIAPPEVEIVEFETGSPLVFEALVDVRPEVHLPDLAEITVGAASAEVTDQDVKEQLDRLRERFAELETVGREARQGDFALIDINGHHHGQPVEDASAPDFLYEIGSRSGPPHLDGELEGSRPGAILKFNDVLPEGSGDLGGQEISFTVLVKEIKAKKLPVADDEFAKTAGEFDTLGELEASIRERVAEAKKAIAEEETRSLVLEAFVDAADLEPPEKLVEAEVSHRLEHFQEELRGAGMTMADYERASNSTELEMRADLRRQAARSVKAELLLEEIARREDIQITEDDIGREVVVAATRAGRDPQEVAQGLADSGKVGAVAADIMRRKALDHVVENANVTGRQPTEESDDE